MLSKAGECMNFSLNRGTLVVPIASLSVHQEENGNMHVHTNKNSTEWSLYSHARLVMISKWYPVLKSLCNVQEVPVRVSLKSWASVTFTPVRKRSAAYSSTLTVSLSPQDCCSVRTPGDVSVHRDKTEGSEQLLYLRFQDPQETSGGTVWLPS